MAIVPAQCWVRTFKIVGGPVAATCFVISRHERQWLITAKHVIDQATAAGANSFYLSGGDGKTVLDGFNPVVVPLLQSGPDIFVFSLGDQKVVDEQMTLVPSANGLILSQEVFFLGYPLPDRQQLSGLLPAVKHGIVSQRAVINGVTVWLIDGHNLPAGLQQMRWNRDDLARARRRQFLCDTTDCCHGPDRQPERSYTGEHRIVCELKLRARCCLRHQTRNRRYRRFHYLNDETVSEYSRNEGL
jgi:hypothetical protein